MLFAWAVISLLILLTALYVAGEYSAVSARRSRVRRLAEDGNPFAARLLPVLEDSRLLYRYIAASQVGITLSSLILGAYSQSTIAPRLVPLFRWFGNMQPDAAESAAEAVVLIVLSTLSVIVGELVPKSFALQNATSTALGTVLPMQWSLRLFARSIDVLNGSAALLLKLLRVPATGHRHVHSPEEIELLIAESRDGGLLEPEEQVRLHRALRLGLRTAGELMVPRSRMRAIEASTPFSAVLRLVAESPYSRLPVYSGSPEQIIGVLHTKDVVATFVRNVEMSLASLLRPMVRVRDTMPADRLLAFLRERRSHQALVVDGAGEVVGFITLEDVLGELLGGVADEFKAAQLRPIRLSDGRLRLPGSMRLDQAARLAGRDWSQADTLGAFVVSRAGRVPEPGERIVVGDRELEIEAVEGNLVTSVIVGEPPTAVEDEER